MKKLLSILIALLLAISMVAFAETAEEVIPDPSVVDAKIVTKVKDEGLYIAGIRIEFDGEWKTGALTTSSFSVRGFVVNELYVSSTGELNEATYTGKYVFVMFDKPLGNGTGEAGAFQYNGGTNLLRDWSLDVNYAAKQEMFKAEGFIHYEVDDYIEGEETGADGYTTKYRLYIPDELEDNLPLVIWLHGAGERGDNNIAQIAANRGALNYSSAEAQAEYKCLVLAPQAHTSNENDQGGWNELALANVNSIVLKLIDEYKIDPSRIYVSGCSMGGGGSKSLMNQYPKMIAGSVVMANSSMSEDDDVLNNLKDIPIILITGAADGGGTADDAMVANYDLITSKGIEAVAFLTENGRNGYLRGQLAKEDLQVVTDAMAEAGVKWAYVTYLADTVIPSAHWSWMAATENEALHDWLFAQVNDAPYTGE